MVLSSVVMIVRYRMRVFCISVVLFSSTGCGYNKIQRLDEEVKGAWAEVINQYKRRADLIPNLVKVVQGYAKHEKDVLTQIAEARSRVGAIQATPELVQDPALFRKFLAAQDQLSGALQKLLAVAENYPQLKAGDNFRDLQAQLEGTENRITVARNRYIESVKDYNIQVRTFPSLITAKIFGYSSKPMFTVENEAEVSKPPEVKF